MRIPKDQMRRFDGAARDLYFAELRADLGLHHPDLPVSEADELFAQCRSECERLGIEGRHGIEAYFGLSFVAGAPISTIDDYEQEHIRALSRGHAPDDLPIALMDRIQRGGGAG